ncbi:MAG: hypothetical protein H8E21_06035 [Gammaproteobacteria bacterium]|nr:hypothetical protein [Gammaproteobacteria bacterium]MBL6999656.1 hypothetical protein [Gammaproteobacteria bacterium]
MLIWVCALHCEAKPLIDFYRLKKSADRGTYDTYQRDQISCIVSGMGQRNMAQAIDWAANQFSSSTVSCWINLGVAGDKSLAIGSTVLASRVSQIDLSGQTDWLETSSPLAHRFIAKAVTSLQREQTDYDSDSLYDMEAFAFIHSTRQYAPAERCQSIKIISDNSDNPPHRNKARISQLIADNIPAITDYAAQLHQLR